MSPAILEGKLEAVALELTEKLGWETANCLDEVFGDDGTYGRDMDEPFLAERLKAALRRLNPDVPEAALADAYEQLTRPREAMSLVNANREVYGLLKEGVKVNLHLEEGGTELVVVTVVDWREPSNNDFLMVQQLWMLGETYKRRADLVGFVNGLPLVFIELKTIHKDAHAAFQNNFRDYKSTVPQFFHANAVVIVSNGLDNRVGSLTGAWEHFKEWKRVEREDEAATSGLETVLRGVCQPGRLLDLVENFTLFSEQSAGVAKIVGQNHQFLGVNNALGAVERIKDNQGRLGVFWHTQGSGKSFSMVFFSQKILRTVPGDWTFLVLTDRDDLDDQIYKTFVGCGAVKVAAAGKKSKAARAEEQLGVQATSGDHLKKLLTENHRYVFTLIQKFQVDKAGRVQGEKYPLLSKRNNIIVIADEAHRSQYDTYARNLRQALPNAAFIGFTGTPLMDGEEQTKATFGDYVSIYNFRQAIEDNATVPLYYENRIPELQLDNDDFSDELADIIENADLDEEQRSAVDREFGRQYHLITRDERLDKVAADIVAHYMGLGEGGSRGKAMVISIDKVTAVKMYNKVQTAWKAHLEALKKSLAGVQVGSGGPVSELEAKVAFMEETEMAVVVSEQQNEVEDFRELGLDITPHRKRMKKGTVDLEFKDDEHPLRIVFVCAMWLTGFDVPSCSSIYLDKPMRNHTLMQTIARANRVYPGKLSGLIVDYIGVFRNLQKALTVYGGVGGTAQTDTPVRPKEELINELHELLESTKLFAADHGAKLEALRTADTLAQLTSLRDAREALIHPDTVRRQFLSMAGRVDRLFKHIGLDTRVNPLLGDRTIIKMVAEAIRANTPPADISQVMDEVEKLLDRSIATEGYVIPEPTGPMMVADIHKPSGLPRRFDLSKLDFDALKKFFEKTKSKRATLDQLQQAAKQKTEELLEKNPTRIDLYEKLEALIAEYNAGSHNVQESFEQIREFIESLNEEEQRHTKESLTEEELAIFDLLTKPNVELKKKDRQLVKELAKDLVVKLKKELVIDWRKKRQGKARVRRTIEDVLDPLPPDAYSDDLYEEKCTLIFDHIFECYQGDGESRYGAA
jgi:type I restriction enzyme R subunit